MDAADCLLLRVSEAAHRLSIGRSTLYQQIAAGEIRVVKIGRATRVPATELASWIARRAVPGLPECGEAR